MLGFAFSIFLIRMNVRCAILPDLPLYYMHTVQLPNVNERRDLGVFVDSHCNFKHHISHICCKAYTSINIIFRCFDTAHVDSELPISHLFVRY